MTKYKPFLKWAGNKYHCIEQILSALPSSNRLVEPFTGSGSILLNTNYPQYLLAEHNPDLVHLFQFLQKEGTTFIDACAVYFSGSHNNATDYYRLRNLFNESKDPKLRTILFVYLNRHGYNGLCRYNSKGIFNVPFGRYINPYFPRMELMNFFEKSQDVIFLQADFRETFRLAKSGDVIYCDPPYVPLSDSAYFSAYSSRNFTRDDQVELAQLAIKCAEQGITVIISNHDTPFTREQYQSAEMVSFPVRRFISCKANQRMRAQELLAIFKPN